MKRVRLLLLLAVACGQTWGQKTSVCSPDSLLKVEISVDGGMPSYTVTYNGKVFLERSPLGFTADVGDFSRDMTLTGSKTRSINESYKLDRIKQSNVKYTANELKVSLANKENKPVDVTFRVSDNDIALRYEMPRYGETGSIVIQNEATGFNFPSQTTTFLTPQSDAMIGWKRTKPSYEEEYTADAPLAARSKYGHGFTFPCLFHIGGDGWVLVSETGVDSRYCASHLSDATPEGLFTVAFPMPEENNGNGTVAPGMALPGATPWRTITVGETLKPIVETTVPWDVVEPRYASEHKYKYGRGTWSWIMWQDGSINYDDQKTYIDLAADMGYEYALIDNWWNTNIGRDKMAELAGYAKSKNVSLLLWYSSSGYWNDIEQGPTNLMDNPIARKQEMRWLRKTGVKGIKVDFFGGDKQETMRLYEAILSDADDNGLMVIFHGCTLPRGKPDIQPAFRRQRGVQRVPAPVHKKHRGMHGVRRNAAQHAAQPHQRRGMRAQDHGRVPDSHGRALPKPDTELRHNPEQPCRRAEKRDGLHERRAHNVGRDGVRRRLPGQILRTGKEERREVVRGGNQRYRQAVKAEARPELYGQGGRGGIPS